MKPYLLIILISTSLTACLQPIPTTQTPDILTTQTPTPIPATATPQPETCAEVTASSLHIRIAADFHTQTLGWLTGGTTARILSDPAPVTGWTKVHAPGIDAAGHKTHITGFVKSEYLTFLPCAADTSATNTNH